VRFSILYRLLKNPRSPFENLRANGAALEMVEDFPFVPSLSKHFDVFFNNLFTFDLDHRRLAR
jgi:hypothetical protein